MLKAALIADDLTGALDSAVAFAERGLRTRVARAADALDGAAEGADVIAVNAATRHLPEDRAVAAVATLAGRLARHGPAAWFKKIDSTLRGHVAAETVALLETTGLDRALICPAVPAQGRTVIDGIVMVHGTPLAETEFARDAVTPAPRAPLMDQFARRDRQAGTGPAPPNAPLWIADARTDADLRARVAWAAALAPTPLLVGAAGLADAFAETVFGSRGRGAPLPPLADGPVLVVMGSRAGASRDQAAALAARSDCLVLTAPLGHLTDAAIMDAIAATSAQSLLLQVPATPESADPSAVSEALGRGAGRLIQRYTEADRAIAAVMATGGDTADALLDALGAATLTVLGELCPGVPISRLDSAHGAWPLITKAGGFGDRDLLVQLPDLLRARVARP